MHLLNYISVELFYFRIRREVKTEAKTEHRACKFTNWKKQPQSPGHIFWELKSTTFYLLNSLRWRSIQEKRNTNATTAECLVRIMNTLASLSRVLAQCLEILSCSNRKSRIVYQRKKILFVKLKIFICEK